MLKRDVIEKATISTAQQQSTMREIAKKYDVNDKTVRLRRYAEKWDEGHVEIPQKIRSAENADVIDNVDVRTHSTAENSAAEPQESAGILKPQWEHFAQNVAQVIADASCPSFGNVRKSRPELWLVCVLLTRISFFAINSDVIPKCGIIKPD